MWTQSVGLAIGSSDAVCLVLVQPAAIGLLDAVVPVFGQTSPIVVS